MNILRTRRKNLRFTQQYVSRHIGISRQYYAYLETGKRGKYLPVSLAKRLAEVLEFDWTLLYEEDIREAAGSH